MSGIHLEVTSRLVSRKRIAIQQIQSIFPAFYQTHSSIILFDLLLENKLIE